MGKSKSHREHKGLSKRENISGKQIRKARKRLGLKQIDIAVALESDYGIRIDQSDISEIEREVRGLRDYELDAIARILNINPTSLLRSDESEKN